MNCVTYNFPLNDLLLPKDLTVIYFIVYYIAIYICFVFMKIDTLESIHYNNTILTRKLSFKPPLSAIFSPWVFMPFTWNRRLMLNSKRVHVIALQFLL